MYSTYILTALCSSPHPGFHPILNLYFLGPGSIVFVCVLWTPGSLMRPMGPYHSNVFKSRK